VLPFVDRDKVLMVRQYRYVYSENFRWEMPTGGVKPGESKEVAAHRELCEEAGYDARNLIHVSTYFTSKSIIREIGHLYIGHDLFQVEAVPDDTELLEIAALPFDEVLDLVNRSEIRDSMTVIAVLQAARLRQAGQLF